MPFVVKLFSALLTATVLGVYVPIACSQTATTTIHLGNEEHVRSIDRRTWNKNRQVIFVPDSNKLDLGEIDFIVINGLTYAPINIDSIDGFDEQTASGYIFPEVLVSGTISVYRIRSNNRILWAKDGRVKELRSPERGNGNYLYRLIVLNDVRACKAITDYDVSTLPHRAKAFKWMAKKYNTICGVFEFEKSLYLRTSLAPVLGFRKSDYEFKRAPLRSQEYFSYLALARNMKHEGAVIGIEAKVEPDKDRIHMEYAGALYFGKFEDKSYIEESLGIGVMGFRSYNTEYHLNLLTLAIKPRIVLPFGEFACFVGVGYTFTGRLDAEGSTLIHEEATYTPPAEKLVYFDPSDFPVITKGWLAEFGVRYGRFTLELNRAWGLSQYLALPVEEVSAGSLSIGVDLVNW